MNIRERAIYRGALQYAANFLRRAAKGQERSSSMVVAAWQLQCLLDRWKQEGDDAPALSRSVRVLDGGRSDAETGATGSSNDGAPVVPDGPDVA